MTYKKLKDFKFKDKKVLVRVDFNVPLKDGKVADDSKIKAALPTLKHILKEKPERLILMSHLGRPNGRVVEELRMEPVSIRLAKLLELTVCATKDSIVDDFCDSCIILLENLRFHAEEKENNEEFAKKLASYADVYVNDAFGTAHREHASNNAITKFLPSCAGLLFDDEIVELSKALEPEHPYVAIIGGAKMDKILLMDNLLHKADKILFGGVLANTMLRATGKEVGTSVYDNNSLDLARDILRENEGKVVLPVDVVTGNKIAEDAEVEVHDVDQMSYSTSILDMGPKTIEIFKKEIAEAKTITWTGPIGVFEIDKFAKGTEEVVKALAESDAVTIIGGGDSAASVVKFGMADKMTHVSTGGGASIKFLGGNKLAAVEALEENLKSFN